NEPLVVSCPKSFTRVDLGFEVAFSRYKRYQVVAQPIRNGRVRDPHEPELLRAEDHAARTRILATHRSTSLGRRATTATPSRCTLFSAPRTSSGAGAPQAPGYRVSTAQPLI